MGEVNASTPDSESDDDDDDPKETLQLWALDKTILADSFHSAALNPSEAIVFTYYIKHVSGVLPAHDATGNPYRQLASLALDQPVLLHTVLSIASMYMYSQGGLSNVELITSRQGRALSSLRKTLSIMMNSEAKSQLMTTEALVTAVLLQIFYLALTGGCEVEPHFNGALFLLRKLGYLQNPVRGYFSRMIIQRFATIDVARAIYRRTRPVPRPDFWFYHTNGNFDDVEPSFRSMAGYPHPVLLFLVQVAELSCDARERPNSLEVTKAASDLEVEMHLYWASSSDVYLDALGKCFYWTAYLLLQRRVYGDSSRSRRVQLTAKTIFELIESMRPGCGHDSSVFLPFNIAAREALSEDDRTWVREKNATLSKTYHVDTNGDCMSLIEKIWQCVDSTESTSDDGFTEERLLEIEAQSQCFAF